MAEPQDQDSQPLVLEPREHLEPRPSAEVMALAVRATTHDGIRPLSEQTVLNLRRLAEAPGETASTHLVVEESPGVIDSHVLGYAHVERTEPPSAEIVVDPSHRRQGIGGALVRSVLEHFPDARLWAHGNLPAAQGLARAHGLTVVRELWQMARPLAGEWSELPEVELPEGFSSRAFEVGRDEQAWLQVNARAFADHPEQGRTTAVDLAERMAEPWFDPSGFLLIEDQHVPEGQPARLAAFHWTKIEPAQPGHSTAPDGEVYVVGVDPDYQGRGLGRAVTVLGLRHLLACGMERAVLYVDGDNAAAIATYHRLGFERTSVDVQYADPQHAPGRR
ncbi:mycothiol synthase [Ornithinicoccus halotolerans]|uniref:mycothiol synthase n=1 Tax=Ornithinicoccus halotolerans TaxID=1748220 RepID=UPI001295E432|nr:mycothiol synthase [Ornithinicoccus halotolerans]